MFFVSFQKWTVIVDTAGHINYSNDKCPWWTVIVEKSTIVVQWTVIVAAATISVHDGQLSLMDSYRCYSAFVATQIVQSIFFLNPKGECPFSMGDCL